MARKNASDAGQPDQVLIELLGNIRHDGVNYSAGATLEVSGEAAQALFAAGAARKAEDAAAE